MSAFLFGLFGLIVGSFLNVVILRHGERTIRGRSACPSCKKQLQWFDMVPVVSWFALAGRCRHCGARISLQYPLVEAATALLFALIDGADLPFLPMLIALAIAALLLCILVYDLYHQIIPDMWVWPFCALALASVILNSEFSILDLLTGLLAALPILFLWVLSLPFTGKIGMWMGFGDVKLALGMGWLLGFPAGLFAVFFAFIIGATVSVPILLWGKLRSGGVEGLTMKSEVPFGPFLIASTFIVWFALMYNVPLPLSL
jgi:leader peptidase (prepilin peptidase)/N-methyltransferase